MIRQTVLPFKVERTDEWVTARNRLALYAEFMRAMGVETLVDHHLPKPGSGRGLKASQYIMPLSLTLDGGGETIEDVRELQDDHTLRAAIDLRHPLLLRDRGLTQADGRERRPSGDGPGQRGDHATGAGAR